MWFGSSWFIRYTWRAFRTHDIWIESLRVALWGPVKSLILADIIKNWEARAASLFIVFLNTEAACCFETYLIITFCTLACNGKADSSDSITNCTTDCRPIWTEWFVMQHKLKQEHIFLSMFVCLFARRMAAHINYGVICNVSVYTFADTAKKMQRFTLYLFL